MLQLAHRTCAPSATSVSIRTAVWTVMCSEPVILAPRSGCACSYSARTAIRPGISCSASVISLRPNSASERSATLNGSSSVGMSTPVVRAVGWCWDWLVLGLAGAGTGWCWNWLVLGLLVLVGLGRLMRPVRCDAFGSLIRDHDFGGVLTPPR